MWLYIDCRMNKTHEGIGVYAQPDAGYLLFGTVKEAEQFCTQCVQIGLAKDYLIIAS